MSGVWEGIIKEDLNLGVGATTITAPGGGSLPGTQISLSTFAVTGAKVSTTWDPSSVLAAQSVTTTITVPGALLGDFVMASFSLDLAGCTLAANVSSSNTITAVISNPTTAAIDLSSGTLNILVFIVR